MTEIEQELAKREAAWRAGSFPALIEAVAICRACDLMPAWLAEAVIDHLSRAYWPDDADHEPTGGTGRESSLRGAELRRHIDYFRYRRVRWLLRIAGVDKTAIPAKHRHRELRWAVFYTVSEQLRGHPFAAGQARPIKESYERVCKAISEDRAAEYFIAGLR